MDVGRAVGRTTSNETALVSKTKKGNNPNHKTNGKPKPNSKVTSTFAGYGQVVESQKQFPNSKETPAGYRHKQRKNCKSNSWTTKTWASYTAGYEKPNRNQSGSHSQQRTIVSRHTGPSGTDWRSLMVCYIVDGNQTMDSKC
ncbi:hypothetical protein QZH41_008067 [Actinostola sp. cb2023]|nr:hypothetical protein QZH41_008067 [Actinostola sp. cb2023]